MVRQRAVLCVQFHIENDTRLFHVFVIVIIVYVLVYIYPYICIYKYVRGVIMSYVGQRGPLDVDFNFGRRVTWDYGEPHMLNSTLDGGLWGIFYINFDLGRGTTGGTISTLGEELRVTIGYLIC